MKFGNVIKEINKSRTQLEELLAMNADRKDIREASDRLNELLYREEMMWMQRSRVDWLKEGDRNTKFFHRRAKWRARKNRIKKLIDAAGAAHTDHATMAAMVSDYFSTLFTADNSICPDPVINLINCRVSDRMNTGLCADFSDKEIADARFPDRTPKGPRTGWISGPVFPKELGCDEGASHCRGERVLPYLHNAARGE